MRRGKFAWLVVLGVLALLLSTLSISAFAQDYDPGLVQKCNEYIDQKFHFADFFTEANQQGMPLRQHMLRARVGLDEYLDAYPMLVWGPWHGDMKGDRARFIGYGRYGEDVTNPEFPPDASGGGAVLSSREWIPRPWDNPSVRRAYPNYIKSREFDGFSDPEVIDRLRTGLIITAICNGYSIDDPSFFSSDLWQNPQEYVHITLPPSPGVWGMGVMFRWGPGGSVWYVSVPLYPGKVPFPKYAVGIEPKERTGRPGEEAAFDVCVSWKDNPRGRSWRLILAHRVGNRQYPVPFTLTVGGEQVQAVMTDTLSYADFPYTTWEEGELHVPVAVHVQNIPSTLIAQVVPLDPGKGPLEPRPPYNYSPYWQAEARVRPLGCDLAVGPGGPVTVFLSWDQPSRQVTLHPVFRRKDGLPGEVPYTAFVEGPGGRVDLSGSFSVGGYRQAEYTFVVSAPGTYTVRAEVWPVPEELETNPGDNTAVWTVRVVKQSPPRKYDRDNLIHGELGS